MEDFSIGEVAAMVGLSAPTIRAWERRHRVVSPSRSPSGQRRYRLADVETLKRVKDLASSRGLSLRMATADALGEAPQLEARPTGPAVAGGDDLTGDTGPWRAVADLDPRAVVILNPGGQIVDCNVAFARACGQLRFELRGAAFADLVDGYDRAKAVAIYRGNPEPRVGWELNLCTAAGAGLFSFDCLPFRQPDGWCWACAGRDVSRSV